MQKFEELKNLIASLEGDADKFYNKGNSAAGTRVRKGMQDLKNLAQEIRAEVQEIKNKAIIWQYNLRQYILSIKYPWSLWQIVAWVYRNDLANGVFFLLIRVPFNIHVIMI